MPHMAWLVVLCLVACSGAPSAGVEVTNFRPQDLTEEEYQALVSEDVGGAAQQQPGMIFNSRMARPVGRKERRDKLAEKQQRAGAKDQFVPSNDETAEIRKLDACLKAHASFGYYDSIICYDFAIEHYPLNATWFKRRGTLHMLADAPAAAMSDFNHSVSLLFKLARYGTESDHLKQNGMVALLTLFERRDIGTAIEVGKLVVANATYHHAPSDALALYDWLHSAERADDDIVVMWAAVQFLSSYGMWNKLPDLLQKVAAVLPEYASLPRLLFVYRLVSEAADVLGRRLLSTSRSPAGTLVGARDAIRQHCGREDLPHRQHTYTRRELDRLAADCFLKHLLPQQGSLRRAAAAQKPTLQEEYTGFTQSTPLHLLALINAPAELFAETLKLGIGVHRIDRFGQTPLHVAMGAGRYEAATSLLRQGASLKAKDARQRTPLETACAQASWIDRTRLAALVGDDPSEDPCDIDDDVDLVTQVRAKPRKDQGGWSGAAPAHPAVEAVLSLFDAPPTRLPGMKPHNSRCQLDILELASLGGLAVAEAAVTSRPKLIRGAVPNKLAKRFSRKAFEQGFGLMKGRAEPFPRAEDLGLAPGRVMRLSEFAAQGPAERPDTFTEKVPGRDPRRGEASDVVHAASNHPLREAAEAHSMLMKLADQTALIDTEDQFVSYGPRGSGFQAAVSAVPVVHSMPYGVVRWFLVPPPEAFVSQQHPLDTLAERAASWRSGGKQQAAPLSGRTVLECEQHPGDMLVIPPHWGAVGVRMRESITLSKRLDMDQVFEGRPGEAPEAMKQDGKGGKPGPKASGQGKAHLKSKHLSEDEL